MSSELARVALLGRIFADVRHAHLRAGIGDDAAVLTSSNEQLVWTVDASVEGVHFRRDLLSLEDIGYRATMAAASDLAAMGARPLGLLAALVLPSWVTDSDLEALARGQREAVGELGTVIAGGNLARGGELSITTTALGAATRPLMRGGARVGDIVWASGPLGLAGAGFAALTTGRVQDSEELLEAIRAAIHAWRRPRARIREGLLASSCATAAIDVSDGLARDLGHLARASDVSVAVDAARILGPELRQAAALLGRDALELALHGGEDYALLVTTPKDATLSEAFTRIGDVLESEASEASGAGAAVIVRHADGRHEAVLEGGFDHFTGS